ncbi:MAG TPA: tRNA preQ1(34) S-adenosylmethionine ribosyltransferase-isomerase QueA [Ktedonobacterales bacterium]|nr:tRNA preQ1(34) S-adenosylmethionine ribosyltransferase-isomerase QueA [Ktedonobacterales bacterium]
MRISDFDYTLPPERIAQSPVEPRDSSRLLVVHRDTGAFEHRIFRDITDYLRPGDLLVANQSRVLPARLRGVKAETGGQVEVLLLTARSDVGPNCWEALVKPGRRIHPGQRLSFGDGALLAEALETTPSGGRIIRLTAREGTVAEAVERVGVTPLPPYIHEPLADAERYQTVYAREPGSAAAPTAGLHFTTELLEQVGALGVGIAYVTLHIGLDTFRPVEKDDLSEHVMHSEEIELTPETAARINATRAAGGRIIAVGTTSVRTLEAVAQLTAEAGAEGVVTPYRGRTQLFITPGYQFRAVDAMMTNFHLPRSTLLALVSAFAGRELIARAYQEAIAREYRFYSFGDAMLLL